MFDDAPQCNEIFSILPTIFNISAFLLFGDRRQAVRDELCLDLKYKSNNYGQSLFHRIYNSGNSTLRILGHKKISLGLFDFLNNQFYGNDLHASKEIVCNGNENNLWIIKDFVMFCFEDDQVDRNMVKFIKKLFFIGNPKKFTYRMIVPTNFSKELDEKTRSILIITN